MAAGLQFMGIGFAALVVGSVDFALPMILVAAAIAGDVGFRALRIGRRT
jgi:hypothetical protein